MSRKPRSLVSFQDAAMARRGAALIARNAAGLRLRIDPPASRQSRFADKRPTKTETRYAAGAFNNKALHRIEPPIASGKDQGNVDLARKPLRIGSEERLSIEVAHTAVPPVPAHFYSRRAVSRQQLRRFNAVVLSQAALHAVGAVQLHDQRNVAPTRKRTASTTSTRKRARFRRAPPYSSRRLLSKGLKNWLSR